MTFDEQVAVLRKTVTPKCSNKKKAECTPEEWAANLEYQKRSRDREPDRFRAYSRKWAAKHPDAIRTASKRRWAENKEQCRENNKRWKAANRQRVNAANKRWYEAHKTQHRKACQSWLARHPGKASEYTRKWCRAHAERRRQQQREWRKKNADRVRAYAKNRLASNLSARVRMAMSSSIRQALRRAIVGKVGKPATTMRLIGCTVHELMQHLESQFLPGMTWDNWGRGKGKWHIDHVFPLAKAPVTNPVLAATAFSYVNLRPLWGHDNQSKSDSLQWDAIHHHYMNGGKK